MIKTNAFLAGASFGIAFAIVFTIFCIIAFSIFMICFWWVDIKKRPLKELWIEVKKFVWSFFETIYDFFHSNTTVSTVYSDKSMNYSGTEFLPIPTKAPTNQYTYEFVGWDKNGVDENGNIVVKAIYLQKVMKCYINVFDDDKTTLLHSAVVEYGAGVNLSDIKPTKPESKEFSYEFVGWDKDTNAFYKNENVYAVYNAIPKKYTYKFVQEDGESIVSQGTAIYGTPIIAPKPPKKTSSSEEVYEFAGWKNYTDGMLLVKNEVFVAEYTTKPVGGQGTSSIIKTNGEQIQVVEESKLSAAEDSSQEEIKISRLASAIKFDTGAKQSKPIEQVKVGESGVIRKQAGMLVQSNSVEKFREIKSTDSQVNEDDEVHQKIQLMTIKKSKDVKDDGSNVIKIKPKKEEEPKEDEILKNMMINKIKIDKKDDN